MKSKMILGELETASYMPEADVFRGYENLRTEEWAGVGFNLLEKSYRAERIKVWQEGDTIYASMIFLKATVEDAFVGYDARRRESRQGEDFIYICPVFEHTNGIAFSEYQMNKVLNVSENTHVLEISAYKKNVKKVEMEKFYPEKDFRKWFHLQRKNGQASLNYVRNLFFENKTLLKRKAPETSKEILPNNVYAEIMVKEDPIATNALREMEKEGTSSEQEYLVEAYNSLHIYKGSSKPYKELEELEGLEDIKEDVSILAKKLEYHKNRKMRGKVNHANSNMHMCFMGSPGTGKTTLARIMVGILYEMGMIEHNEFVEIAATDLKAKYANQTAKKTELVLRSAYGRVLFIDEAYALASEDKQDYGREAINEILKQMEDHRDKLIIIFAGYKAQMEEFLDMNIGFRSRINRYYEFKDFSAFECTNMVLRKFEQHYSFSTAAIVALYRYFMEAKRSSGFGNIRTVKMVCNKMVKNWSYRCTYNKLPESLKYIIEEEDIQGI